MEQLSLLDKENGDSSIMLINRITDSFFSKRMNRMKHVTILAPEYREDDFKRYPVLYLLHGYGGNRNSWINNTNIAKLITDYPMVIVFPESGRRWFINDFHDYCYEDYLIQELICFIEAKKYVKAGRQARGIGGFSMGGAAAIFQALRYPSIFSVAFSHSGAFEGPLRVGDPYAAYRSDVDLLMPTVEMHEKVWGPPGSEVRKKYDPYNIIDSWSHRYDLKLYFDQGVDDFERMVNMNRKFHLALETKNIPHVYKEKPGKHDWNYINDNLSFSLRYAYSQFYFQGNKDR